MQINGIENMSYGELKQDIAKGGKFVIYTYAISIVVLTFRRSSPSIYYVRSNESPIDYGWPWLLISLFLGWWGIPFGPIYTIESIVQAFTGKDITDEVMASIESNLPASKPSKHQHRYHLQYQFIPNMLRLIERGELQPGYLYSIDSWKPWIAREVEGFEFDWNEMGINSFKIDDNRDLIFYRFPDPEQVPEAVFGAVVLNRKSYKSNYYTLEISFDGWMLGRTTVDDEGRKSHANYGKLENPSAKAFIDWVIKTEGTPGSSCA